MTPALFHAGVVIDDPEGWMYKCSYTAFRWLGNNTFSFFGIPARYSVSHHNPFAKLAVQEDIRAALDGHTTLDRQAGRGVGSWKLEPKTWQDKGVFHWRKFRAIFGWGKLEGGDYWRIVAKATNRSD